MKAIKKISGLFKRKEKLVETPKPKEHKKGAYYMWKPIKEDPSFKNSEIVKLIDKLYDTIEGFELHTYNSYAILANKRLDKVPEEETYLLGQNKEWVKYLISLSMEKGFRIRFDYTTDYESIVKELNKVIKIFGDIKKQIGSENKKPQTKGKEWWKFAKKSIILMEKKGDKPAGVGILFPQI